MRTRLIALSCLAVASAVLGNNPVLAQSISGGTIAGVVKDPSGATVPGATLKLRNAVTSYEQTATSDASGAYRFNNVPLNTYRLSTTAPGFSALTQTINVASTVPLTSDVVLMMAEVSTSVDVVETAGAVVLNEPSAHTDADTMIFSKLPSFDPAAGLSSVINNSTGGTSGDANGFFHPLGDHAQVSFVIDGQPISDQQSKVFSTQIPANAIQNHGADYRRSRCPVRRQVEPGGERHDEIRAWEPRSLSAASRPTGVRSGLGVRTPTSASALPKFGNFIAINGMRTGHFLDTPEFLPIHDIGNNENIFDRLDYQPDAERCVPPESVRGPQLVPGSEQLRPAQPGPETTRDDLERRAGLSAHLRLAIAADGEPVRAARPGQLLWKPRSVRRYSGDDVAEPLPDQLRREGRSGRTRTDRHNLKFGTQIQQTRLLENFALGITDPTSNPVCLGCRR